MGREGEGGEAGAGLGSGGGGMGRLINANEPAAAAAAGRRGEERRSRVTHWLPVTPRAAILLRGKEEEGTGAKGDGALGLGSAVSDRAARRRWPSPSSPSSRPAFPARGRAAGWRAGRRRKGAGRRPGPAG